MKPTVSNLIDLLDKPALVKWANKIGLEGTRLDDYKSKAKENGTDYHLRVENFLKFGMLSDDQLFDEAMVRFFKDKVIISVEQKVETDYFVGRYDVKLMWKDFTFVCDMKSNQKGIYFENKVQLAAYAMVEKCHVAVIKLPEFIFHPITYEVDLYEQFIIALSNVWQIKQKIQ
jgi:hypothetical protein